MAMLSATISFGQYTHPVECHYRLIIETNPYISGCKTVEVGDIRITYKSGIYKAYISDTVCNKEYEGLGNLLHDMKILLNRLAKEKEYNDVNYIIRIKNITNKGIETFDIFHAKNLGWIVSKKYINEDINEILERIKRSEFKTFESERLNLHINLDKRTTDGKFIYTDGEDEYIFDEEELTFKKREKKKQL
jgi:hypothetical protein